MHARQVLLRWGFSGVLHVDARGLRASRRVGRLSPPARVRPGEPAAAWETKNEMGHAVRRARLDRRR